MTRVKGFKLLLFLFMLVSNLLLSQVESVVTKSGVYLIDAPALLSSKTDIFIMPGEILEVSNGESYKYVYSVTYKGIRGFISRDDVYPLNGCDDNRKLACNNSPMSLYNDEKWLSKILVRDRLSNISIENITTLIPNLYDLDSKKIDCSVVRKIFSNHINTIRECHKEHSWWILSMQGKKLENGNMSLLFLMNNGSWDDVYYVTINKCGEIQNMFLVLHDVIENYDAFEIESELTGNSAKLVYHLPNDISANNNEFVINFEIDNCGVFNKESGDNLNVSSNLDNRLYTNVRYGFSISYPTKILFRGAESLNGDGVRFYSEMYDQIGLVSGRQIVDEELVDEDISEKYGKSYNLMSRESFNQQLSIEDEGFKVVDHTTDKGFFVIKAKRGSEFYYQYSILTKGISGSWCLADLKLKYTEKNRVQIEKMIPELTFNFKRSGK